MLSRLRRLSAVFAVTAKRMATQPGLIIAAMLGLVAAIALTMSVPFYADAVYARIFHANLSASETETQRSPFAFLFRYNGNTYGPLEWEAVESVNAYLSEQAGAALGIPQQVVVRYISTEPCGLFAAQDSDFEKSTTPLVWVSFGFISDLENHITLIDGRFPDTLDATTADADTEALQAPLEVLVSEALAREVGVQINEVYFAIVENRTPGGKQSTVQIPVRIAGVWRATDPQEAYWFSRPSAFENRLLVPERTFSEQLSTHINNEVYIGSWSLVMDGSEVTHNDADALLRHSMMMQNRAASLLPNIKLVNSPVEVLSAYQREVSLLTLLLYAFSVPILGLLLAFIGLTSGLGVEQRRNEIAVLRSRGAQRLQMLGIAFLESLILGSLALGLSIPGSALVTHLIGQTRSFLDFSATGRDIQLQDLTLTPIYLGLGALGVTLIAQVLPTFRAAKHTIITYKQERARQLQKPWWQRAFLDLWLMIPAAYGAYLLREQGSVIVLSTRENPMPLQDPLLFLVPALGIFALTLLFLRLMPTFMAIIAWVAARTRSVGLLMAARHLARAPRFYSTPLILLVLTLSLSAFTASVAYTMDKHLHDQLYYQFGANLQFLDLGESQRETTSLFDETETTTNSQFQDETPTTQWFFLPVSEYLKLPGVERASRVGRYPALTRLSEAQQNGVFMGVDRADFPQIAFWRSDFADENLGALMNLLALHPDGILVPQTFLDEHYLLLGDTIRVIVETYGQAHDLNLKIVGTFNFFPTWYPERDGPLFVGDLDYFFHQIGGQFPYRVWAETAPNIDYEALSETQGGDAGLRNLDWEAPGLKITERQRAPERQGIFGLLSVGFIAAGLLTVLGFLLYALFSFRRRFIEFGVLRAIGLSTRQMVTFLGWELAFLILMGGGLGTALGTGVSAYFIPYLQVGADEAMRVPPYVVDIAWPAIYRIYILFGLLFVVALITLVIMLSRMKIFQAIKLGETA